MHKSVIGLGDGEGVEQDEVYKHGIVINIPTIYVACDANVPDRLTDNLRVVKFETLSKYIPIGLDALFMDMNGLREIVKKLTHALSENTEPSENIMKVVQLLDYMSTLVPDLNLSDPYFNSLNETDLSFDMIMEYVTDPSTTLLVDIRPAPYENYHFYSQIEDPELVTRIRLERQDTDLNRFHRCMRVFEQMMVFSPNHITNSIMRLIAIGCMYMCLIVESRPIRMLSRNDLRANQVGFMVDCFVRSRVLQAWQENPTTQILLADIIRNYDNNHIMVNLCKIPTARERARYLLAKMKEHERLAKILTSVYEQYEIAIRESAHEIEGAKYYVFDNSFVTRITTLDNVDELIGEITADGTSLKLDNVLEEIDGAEMDESSSVLTSA